jgi:hypothetical protein
VPLYILAQGLMIHFRQPNQYIGYIVVCPTLPPLPLSRLPAAAAASAPLPMAP